MSLIFCSVALLSWSCDKDANNAATAKTFVLVHGAWQAPYVWDGVKTQLQQQGYKVLVVQLPAHGDDTTSAIRVNMSAYCNKVITAMSGVSGKVILVGHSMGGVVVSGVAEKVPAQIEKLVYIGAFVPANGQSIAYLSSLDKQSHLGSSILPSDGGLSINIKRDSIVSIFCQDAAAGTQQLVLDKFKVEPAIPFGDTVHLSDANWGKADKYYIHTTLDHAIGIDLQNQMATAAHITKRYSLPTGHCPFLSKPADVTNLLLQIAR